MLEQANGRQQLPPPGNEAVAAHAAPAPTAGANGREPAGPAFEITILRDLAVQLVGSDAGERKRSRPQSHMTKHATPEELAAVEQVMRPFLESEIKRRYENKSHRLSVFSPRVTSSQAAAVKKLCLAYAAHLKAHLAKHPGDDRYHRTQQRLDQTHAVVAEINHALGTPWDDGRTLDECVAQIEGTLAGLAAQLDSLASRTRSTGNTAKAADELLQRWATLQTLGSGQGRSTPSSEPSIPAATTASQATQRQPCEATTEADHTVDDIKMRRRKKGVEENWTPTKDAAYQAG